MKKRRSRVNIQIGAKLRSLREGCGYSQESVAKKVGILRTSLVNIEYGRQNISADMLCKFCAIYEVPFGEFVPVQPAKVARDGR